MENETKRIMQTVKSMKRLAILALLSISFLPVFAQTGFKQLQVNAKTLNGSDYWAGLNRLFLNGNKYRYACITCPSFDPESCILIDDSTLTFITLDKNLFSWIYNHKKSKKPKLNCKTIQVDKQFVIDLCNLIDIASLTADAYSSTPTTDGTTTYFLSYSPMYWSSKTKATGEGEGGNEASHLKKLLSQIQDAIAGKTPFDEDAFREKIHSHYRRLFQLVPTWLRNRDMYDLYSDE